MRKKLHFSKKVPSNYNSRSRFCIFIFRVSKVEYNSMFFNFELATRKSKNKSLTLELRTRSGLFSIFQLWVSNLWIKSVTRRVTQYIFEIELVTWKKNFHTNFQICNSKCDVVFHLAKLDFVTRLCNSRIFYDDEHFNKQIKFPVCGIYLDWCIFIWMWIEELYF